MNNPILIEVEGEAGTDVGVGAEAAAGVFREDHGDVEVGEAEELRELQHGVDVALQRQWQDEDVRRQLTGGSSVVAHFNVLADSGIPGGGGLSEGAD